MLLLTLGAALAAPRVPGEPGAHLSRALREAALAPVDPRAGSIEVVVEAEGPDADALVATLERAGYPVVARAGDRVQVSCPSDRLLELGDLSGVRRVRAPWRASPKSTLTEGWDAVMVQDWHAEGVRGEGAVLGVIDLGFSGWEQLGSSEFPVDAKANLDFAGSTDATHGTEVTEVLYDFAPDAGYIIGAFQTDVQFCEVLTAMVEQDVDVVNASVGFDNFWSTDASSGLTQCVDRVAEDGVAVFVAAGNEHERYRTGSLSWSGDGGVIALEGEPEIWIDSDDGAVDVRLRWSETFGAAKQDIDLVVYNRDGSVCGRSAEPQEGSDNPFEQVLASGCKGRVYAQLYSEGSTASLSGLTAWLYSASGIDSEFQLGEGSISLPGDTVYGVTIGAWSLADEAVAPYSSRGPTEDGRLKPDLVGPSGVSTHSAGHLAFEGTSAATPHAAGVGALWVSASEGHGDADVMKTWLLEGALDLGEPGLDQSSGAGLVQADALPELQRGCGCAQGSGRGWIGAALAGLLVGRRRRAARG